MHMVPIKYHLPERLAETTIIVLLGKVTHLSLFEKGLTHFQNKPTEHHHLASTILQQLTKLQLLFTSHQPPTAPHHHLNKSPRFMKHRRHPVPTTGKGIQLPASVW
jgi:hypothetical protein